METRSPGRTDLLPAGAPRLGWRHHGLPFFKRNRMEGWALRTGAVRRSVWPAVPPAPRTGAERRCVLWRFRVSPSPCVTDRGLKPADQEQSFLLPVGRDGACQIQRPVGVPRQQAVPWPLWEKDSLSAKRTPLHTLQRLFITQSRGETALLSHRSARRWRCDLWHVLGRPCGLPSSGLSDSPS